MRSESIYLLSQIIEHSAERDPNREAFRCMGNALTYAELVRDANTLAAVLADMGVRRRDRVGIFMHKRLESALVINAIWRAGGVYVPIDPGMPLSRVAFVLRDCGIRHLVTEPAQQKALDQLAADGICLDGCVGVSAIADSDTTCMSWDAFRSEPAHAAPPAAQLAADLAYVMYTSGSTGTPKGLMHTHDSGLAYAKLAADLYDIRPNDRLGNHAPLHFDVSTFDYFAGPLAGATTVIIPEMYNRMPASLSKLIDDERLTIWYSVTLALTQLHLRGVLEERDLSTLRWILFCGEPFPNKYLRALMLRLPNARFSNVYGPAEVNQCTYYHVPAVPDEGADPAPIGRVWDNTEHLILDHSDRLVLPGEPGELLIRSATRMRGYWNRPDLTEEKFYRVPLSIGDEAIYLRTGDLVRERDDGEMVFIGRKDRQIKTRGYRVELDEVEAALVDHPDVEEGAVYPLRDADGGLFVAAAVIAKAHAELDEAAVRSHLRSRIAAYALPRQLTFMDDFPRTGSGKINRRALATLQQEALA